MKNVGKKDRLIRLVLGVVMVASAIILQITTGHFWWLGIIGGVLLGTSAVSFCPLYLPFGIRTNKHA